jgi:hypothetical protein
MILWWRATPFAEAQGRATEKVTAFFIKTHQITAAQLREAGKTGQRKFRVSRPGAGHFLIPIYLIVISSRSSVSWSARLNSDVLRPDFSD